MAWRARCYECGQEVPITRPLYGKQSLFEEGDLGHAPQPTRPIRAGRLTPVRAPPSAKRFRSIRCARLTRRHPVKIRRKWTPEAPLLEGQRRGRWIMRVVRRALLLLALSLLTSAATAHAECAWVLWQHSTLGASSRVMTDPVDAHSTRQACGDAIKAALATAEASRSETMLVTVDWAQNSVVSFVKTRTAWSQLLHTVCFVSPTPWTRAG